MSDQDQRKDEQETPELSEGYEAASTPSKQGDGDPRPQKAASSDAQEGGGKESGMHATHAERESEEGESGDSKAARKREGQGQMPGDHQQG